MYMLESSIREGFGKLFNHPCDIFAKIIYIKMSKCVDHFRLTIKDFYHMFH